MTFCNSNFINIRFSNPVCFSSLPEDKRANPLFVAVGCSRQCFVLFICPRCAFRMEWNLKRIFMNCSRYIANPSDSWITFESYLSFFFIYELLYCLVVRYLNVSVCWLIVMHRWNCVQLTLKKSVLVWEHQTVVSLACVSWLCASGETFVLLKSLSVSNRMVGWTLPLTLSILPSKTRRQRERFSVR